MISTLRKSSKLSYSTIGAVVSIPILATAQGAYFLIKFRRNHGDAPYPKSPSRGIVIVSPKDAMASDISSSGFDVNGKQHYISDKIHFEAIKRKTRSIHNKWLTFWRKDRILPKYNHQNSNISNDDNGKKNTTIEAQPFRIFVVGDSLAAGVGSTSGTPVLPEAIARSLSKALGGRPVYWTCHGTPGASTSRIMRDIKELTQGDYQQLTERKEVINFGKFMAGFKETFRDLKRLMGTYEINSNKKYKEKGEVNGENLSLIDDNYSKMEGEMSFEKVLRRLRNIFKDSTEEEKEEREWNQWNSDLLRATSPKQRDAAQYDVVIVLTGLNDLKSIFLPFLQDSDGTNKVSFKEELRKVFYFLIGKNTGRDKDSSLAPSQHHHQFRSDCGDRALVVLPALPTRVLPMLQYPPLCWVIHALCELIDEQKRALSAEYPGDLLFIEAPTIEMIDQIEKGKYFLCAKQKTETVLLALKDVTIRVRDELESLMHKHVQYHDFKDNAKEIELNYEASKNHSLAESMPDSIGSKLVSVDNIHPNNDGYEFWGRHIAEEIIKELRTKNTSK